jgi:putative transposase
MRCDMARAHRLKMAGLTQHVIQRGNNRSEIFRCDDDYEFFLAALGHACGREDVDVHSYVLMKNHTHILVTPQRARGVSLAMQAVGRLYVLYFNRRYSRTGSLFDGRFRSFIIDTEAYWFTCMRYVELNPVRAGIVSRAQDYRWSSYAGNAFGAPNRLLTAHSLYLALGDSPSARQRKWREICSDALDDRQLAEVRQAAQKGGALGRIVFDASSVDRQP